VYLEEIPDSFWMFPSVGEIKHEVKEEKAYDLFISLDCADVNRLGFSKVLFEKAKKTFCVDHHISNGGFADDSYIVPETSSTAELVFNLMDLENIDSEIAEYLYLGIVHDTGVFQYSSTSPRTMEIAAELMRKGIRANAIIDKTYYEKTYVQNKLLGMALSKSVLLLDGKCIVSYITKDVMDEYGAKPKDLEGIVSQLRVTEGVEVAVFMYELAPNEFKISLRASGDVNVSKVAETFGGGGHVKAAGLNMSGSALEIVAQLMEQIGKQL
jgi:phosphoesterase RecJ-like protein